MWLLLQNIETSDITKSKRQQTCPTNPTRNMVIMCIRWYVTLSTKLYFVGNLPMTITIIQYSSYLRNIS